jgi:hypothetical protein
MSARLPSVLPPGVEVAAFNGLLAAFKRAVRDRREATLLSIELASLVRRYAQTVHYAHPDVDAADPLRNEHAMLYQEIIAQHRRLLSYARRAGLLDAADHPVEPERTS